ncbi:SPOR domain-containing protein [Loktanella sp. TSTF-M6]|uniref:SPOR domain-containing protein n=1 Tax=Loktanella gaetbuli TaxID=2881335 RepID=A0ABS8BQX4_9RHOB|nr:SPOR domain-containing protein [Loktanella gaetbuli]MCB5198113.1 SPOR domain-containing protein [Loktanella gaetbuli]
MAVYEDLGAPQVRDASRYTQMAGAALSLTLMIGVGVWGTHSIMRDVSGVPVVRAVEGEMRRAPDHAGGNVADHRGLSVNEVAALGEAGGPEDLLLLAPSGTGLAAEDLDAEPIAPSLAATEVEIIPEDTQQAQAMSADDVLALADQIAAGASPLTALSDGETVDPVLTVDGAEQASVAPVEPVDPVAAALAEALGLDTTVVAGASMTQVLRPMLRPGTQQAAAAPQATAPAEAVLTPVALTTDTMPLPSEALLTDELPVGTKLVQLGAFPSADAASAEWDRLTTRFVDFMAGKSRVIQQASSGGATFFRLRASGFDDLADARRFCATLDAARTACIPVVVR